MQNLFARFLMNEHIFCEWMQIFFFSKKTQKFYKLTKVLQADVMQALYCIGLKFFLSVFKHD